MIKSIINDCHKPITAYIGSKQVWQHFSPDELFANGERGVWFDPSDLSTLFQDVKATVPVTKDGDPVALILDKSQGLELGMNLSDPSNWTGERAETGAIIFSEGTILYNNPGVANPNVVIVKSNTAGKQYKIEFKADLNSEGYVMASVYNTPLNSSYLSVTSSGTYSVIFTSTGDNSVGFRLSGSGSVSDIKVSEIKGNHATQETASARPIYRTDGELHWLEFDGVDDFLISEPVNFSTTSVASAFFARQVVTYSGATNFSLAGNINTSGTFGEYQRSAYAGSVTVALKGTELTVAQVADSSTALSNSVISMRLDLSLATNKQEIDLRVNGAYPILAYGGVGSAGSGNFSTYPIYIGGTQFGVSNMVFRGLVVVSNYSTTEQVSVIENYLASKSGVTL